MIVGGSPPVLLSETFFRLGLAEKPSVSSTLTRFAYRREEFTPLVPADDPSLPQSRGAPHREHASFQSVPASRGLDSMRSQASLRGAHEAKSRMP